MFLNPLLERALALDGIIRWLGLQDLKRDIGLMIFILIRIKIKFPHNYSDKEKRLLERSALTCPVGKSLHSDLNEEIGFIYPE